MCSYFSDLSFNLRFKTGEMLSPNKLIKDDDIVLSFEVSWNDCVYKNFLKH